MKKRLVIFILLLTLVLTACQGNKSASKPGDTIELKQGVNTKTYDGRVAIVLEEVDLENPYNIDYKKGEIKMLDKENDICSVKKNDIVVVFAEKDDKSRVAAYCTNYPYLRGEIDSTLLSYDEELLLEGNQAMVKDAMGYDDIDGKELRRYSGIGIKLEEKDGWTKLNIPGEIEEAWFKDTALCTNFKCETLDIVDIDVLDKVK